MPVLCFLVGAVMMIMIFEAFAGAWSGVVRVEVRVARMEGKARGEPKKSSGYM